MDKDDLYWICNLCGSKENVRGAEMTVGPNHICSVESEPSMSEITAEVLQERIASRQAKIDNVKAKIGRQILHIESINKNKRSLRGHLTKWENQNKKDLAKLEALQNTEPEVVTETKEAN